MTELAPKELLGLQQTNGRWFLKSVHNQQLLYTTNLGSLLRFSTHQCTRLTVYVTNYHSSLGPSQTWAWRIDGHSWHRVSAINHQFSITCNPEQHLVEIITGGNSDLDRVWTGQEGFGIINMVVNHGWLTATPALPVVDFIGDSITAGCWVAGKHASADYRPESNYVGVACDELSLLGIRVAYSAGGVLRPATGGVPNARHYLSSLDAVTEWHPDPAQLVVINLGVNDRHYPESEFITAYDELLQRAQRLFAGIPIVVMIPFKQSFVLQIRQLAHRYSIPVIETANWDLSYTDGLHPDQAGSLRCGHQLAQALCHFLK